MLIEKVLVEISIPVVDRSYDVYLPLDTPLSDVLVMLCSVFNELCKGQALFNENTVLCDSSTGDILNNNLKIYELGIQNGKKLMLI